MPKTRAEIDELLNDLEQKIPSLICDSEPSDLMEAFAGLAEPIRDQAAPADVAHLDGRLNAMLEANELLPPDE